MPGQRCLNCRWWNGREDAAETYHSENNRHGKCEHITPSAALRDDHPARLYPVGTGAWLHTRFDFSCRDWERGR